MSNFRSYLILFILQPFLTVLLALHNKQWRFLRVVLWLFSGYYGYTISIGEESKGSDIVRYVGEMQSLYGIQMTLKDWWDYFPMSGEFDVLRTLLSLSVSRFTDSQSVLLLIYGLIFGYFYSGNVVIVLRHWYIKNPYVKLLFWVFILIMPLWTMGGFRFNTAVHVFLFGLLRYTLYENKKSLFWCYISPLIHYTFLFPLGLFTIYRLTRNLNLKPFYLFFLFSFLTPNIPPQVYDQTIGAIQNERLLERTGGYLEESKVAMYRKGSSAIFGTQRNWYAQLYDKGLRWTLQLFLCYIIFFKVKLNFYYNKDFFKLSLLFFGFANIVSSIPSGLRFYTMANLISITLMISLFNDVLVRQKLKKLRTITLPFILLFIVVSLRSGLQLSSMEAIFGNPIFAFTYNSDYTSLNTILRFITGTG